LVKVGNGSYYIPTKKYSQGYVPRTVPAWQGSRLWRI
jgi:hypothetical protein